MSDLIKKINSLFKKFHSTGTVYERSGIRPYRDWSFVLIGFSLVMLISIIFAFYLYGQASAGDLFVASNTQIARPVTLNNELLAKVIADIAEREGAMLQIQAKPAVPDPSL